MPPFDISKYSVPEVSSSARAAALDLPHLLPRVATRPDPPRRAPGPAQTEDDVKRSLGNAIKDAGERGDAVINLALGLALRTPPAFRHKVSGGGPTTSSTSRARNAGRRRRPSRSC